MKRIIAAAIIAASALLSMPVKAVEIPAGIVWEAQPTEVQTTDLQEVAQGYLDAVGVSVPEELWFYFEDAGEQYNIRPELLAAIAYKESTFRADATNGDCRGLMQVSARWHTERMHRLGFSDLYRVQDNIMTAADYLAEIMQGQPDIYRALMVYNGDTRQEISQYSKEVVAISIALEITRK